MRIMVKRVANRVIRLAKLATAAGVVVLGLAACESPQDTLTLGVIGTTLVGGQAPTHEIEQITPSVSAEAKHKILWHNCARLYGFEEEAPTD